MSDSLLYEKIYRTVAQIPWGRVATYGQIAKKTELGNQPRVVGYALHHLPEGSMIPWHRVINARGMISLRGAADLQRLLLEQEGVEFDRKGKINLNKFLWRE